MKVIRSVVSDILRMFSDVPNLIDSFFYGMQKKIISKCLFVHTMKAIWTPSGLLNIFFCVLFETEMIILGILHKQMSIPGW